MAEATSADSILKLIQMFSGKGTTTTSTQNSSGGTQTAGKVISQDTINGMLKSAMEGTGGLADVASGQRSAGMYNSTTNTMLSNDLLARLTSNLAAQAAPTVTTTSPSSVSTTSVAKQPSLGVGGAAGLGALSLAKPFIDPLMKKLSAGLLSSGGEAAVGGASQMATADYGTAANSVDNSLAALDAVSASGDVSSYGDSASTLASALAPVADAAGEAAGAVGDAFSNWWASNDYGSAADSVDSALDAIDAASSGGGGFMDSFKDLFNW